MEQEKNIVTVAVVLIGVFVVLAALTDPPAWLKRGTPASFGRYNVHATEGEVPDVITSAFVGEVSVLIGEEPAEPLARVLSLRPTQEPMRTATKSPATVPTSDRAVVGDTYDERPPLWDELERIVGYRVTDENFEQALGEAKRHGRSSLDRLYQEHIVAKRTEPQVLVRHGIG